MHTLRQTRWPSVRGIGALVQLVPVKAGGGGKQAHRAMH